MELMNLMVGAEVLPATATTPDGEPANSMVTVRFALRVGSQSSEISQSPLLTLTLQDARTLAKELVNAADQAEQMKRTGPLQ